MFKSNFLDIWSKHNYQPIQFSLLGDGYMAKYGKWKKHVTGASTMKKAILDLGLNIEFTKKNGNSEYIRVVSDLKKSTPSRS